MKKKDRRKKQAKVLRIFRKVHRMMGATLFVFFFLVATTGFLLGWKKNTGDLLGSKTYSGTSTELRNWLPLHELRARAHSYLKDSVSKGISVALDRIDVRPEKGSVKFIFENYYGIQLDGVTGNMLHFDRRRADFVENVHDASLLDSYFNTNGYIKLIYTTIMSLALLGFTITGFWLWYGPKRMKRANK